MTTPTIYKALRDIIYAWDSLEAGDYHPHVVEHWMKKTLAPAINSARNILNQTTKGETV